MLKNLCCLILLCLPGFHVNAQSFYKVIHLSGNWYTAGNYITVRHVGYIPNAYSACNTGPYRISNYKLKTTGEDTCRAYVFSFSEPVAAVRARITNAGPQENIRFFVNGNFYPIGQTDLSDYGGSCKGALISIIKNGMVGGDTSNTNAMVTIRPNGFKIDSVMVYYETGDDAGVHFSFEFESNPQVLLRQPFYDTIKCVGDSMKIKIGATALFNDNNIYQAELSDANGGFSNPVIIGTLADTATDAVIKSVIPSNTPQGTGYRIRISATSPVRYSADNGINIRITPYPKLNLTSNSPVCERQDLIFSTDAEPETDYYWAGPEFFSTKANPVIHNVVIGNTAGYFVTATSHQCKTTDTIYTVVKPIPILKTVSVNTPLCEGDSLGLLVKSTNVRDTFFWYGPNNFTAEGAHPILNNITHKQSGTYSVLAYFHGCYSDTGKVDAIIKVRPAIPQASTNAPVYPGDPLHFTGSCSTPAVTLEWTGPDGFFSTDAAPVIPSPTNNSEGDYTLTASLDGCTSSVKIWANILDKDFYNMYPNPNDGDFYIKLNVLKDQAVPFEVVNDRGQVVYREVNNTVGNVLLKKISLDKKLPIGLYILRIGIEGHSRNVKFRIAY